MANKNRRWDDNAPGKYYVDKDCVLCTVCFDVAPEFFPISEDETHRYVSRQPVTLEEVAKVEEAVGGCPMGAIGDDG
jgi:ferredoxin